MSMAPKTPKAPSILVSRAMGVAEADADAEADSLAAASDEVADALSVRVVWITEVIVVS